MDKFLQSLYNEELTKKASTDFQAFLSSLPKSELEEALGIKKLAVDGHSTPSLPSGGPCKECDAKLQTRPKKEGPAEEPGKSMGGGVYKTAADAPAAPGLFEKLRGGWEAAGQDLAAHKTFTDRLKHPLGWESGIKPMGDMLAKAHAEKNLAHGLGRFARTYAPHAAIGAAGLYGLKKLLGRREEHHPVYASANYVKQAQLLKTASRAVNGAPIGIRRVAAALAAEKMAASSRR
jgi:hypothetical protein